MNPALFTMWLSLLYFRHASVSCVFCIAQYTRDYALDGHSDHPLRKIVHGHIPTDGEYVAAGRLDLVYDDLSLLLTEALPEHACDRNPRPRDVLHLRLQQLELVDRAHPALERHRRKRAGWT